MRTVTLSFVNKRWMLDSIVFNKKLVKRLLESFRCADRADLDLYRQIAFVLADRYRDHKMTLEFKFIDQFNGKPRVETFMFHKELMTIWCFREKPIFSLAKAVRVSRACKKRWNSIEGDLQEYAKLLNSQGHEIAFDVRGIERPQVQELECAHESLEDPRVKMLRYRYHVTLKEFECVLQIEDVHGTRLDISELQQKIDRYWDVGIVPMEGCLCRFRENDIFLIEYFGPKIEV